MTKKSSKPEEQKDLIQVPDGLMEDPWDDRVDDATGGGLPIIKIAYPNSKGLPEDFPTGHMFNTITSEDLGTELEIVWLASVPGNGMFPEDFSVDNKLLCSSNDGVVPCGDGEDPQPGPCKVRSEGHWVAKCPYLKWREHEKTGERQPPRCDQTVTLVLWDLAHQSPALMSVKKKALSSLGRLKNELKYRKGELKHPDFPQLPVNFRWPVKITLKQEKGKKGTYWLPIFNIVKTAPLADDLVKELLQAAVGLKQAAASISMQEIMEHDGTDVPEGEEVEGDTPF